eukprot:4328403-Prymnesium_polylepis.1
MVLAAYGGFFVGAEMLIATPLKPMRALLRQYDLLSCSHPGGPRCRVTRTTWSFSDALVGAARPNVSFFSTSAARVLRALELQL